jgi:hypothetical protein
MSHVTAAKGEKPGDEREECDGGDDDERTRHG